MSCGGILNVHVAVSNITLLYVMSHQSDVQLLILFHRQLLFNYTLLLSNFISVCTEYGTDLQLINCRVINLGERKSQDPVMVVLVVTFKTIMRSNFKILFNKWVFCIPKYETTLNLWNFTSREILKIQEIVNCSLFCWRRDSKSIHFIAGLNFQWDYQIRDEAEQQVWRLECW